MINNDPDFAKTFRQTVAAICAHPDDLKLEYTPGRTGVFVVTPHRDDYGALCGKGGRTLGALKTVVRALGSKAGLERCELLLGEPTIGERTGHKFKEAQEFDQECFKRNVTLLAADIFDGKLHFECTELVHANWKVVLMAESLRFPVPGLEAALALVLAAMGAALGAKIIGFELKELS